MAKFSVILPKNDFDSSSASYLKPVEKEKGNMLNQDNLQILAEGVGNDCGEFFLDMMKRG